MNQIQALFPEKQYIQVGDHYLPFELTPLSELTTPLSVCFPYSKGVLSFSGEENEDFLQRMTTCDVGQLEVGKGGRSLFCDRLGKILFDVFILKLKDEILIVTDPGDEERLKKYLQGYIIMEEIEITNVSAEYEVLFLLSEGTSSFDLNQLEQECWSLYENKDPSLQVLFVKTSMFPKEIFDHVGYQLIGLELFEKIRPYFKFVRAGVDFNHHHLPQEASLEKTSVSFNKGCYLGQEPISRIAYRGRVTNCLYQLKSKAPFEDGTQIVLDDKVVGSLTSTSDLLLNEFYYSLARIKTKAVEGALNNLLSIKEILAEIEKI